MKIVGVVLAAGSSTRLGRPKQKVMVDGETLVERASRIAHEAGLSPVIVVLAPNADFRDSLQQQHCQIVVNKNASEGMASSIRCGVSAANGCDGVVVMACDQPDLSASHLRELCAEPQSMCGSGYAGKVGIPAYFPASDFGVLLALKGDQGARGLLQQARSIIAEELSFDIDTKEDIARLANKTKCDPLYR